MPEKMTTKERVLAGIQRRGSASPTILMQTCHASADELKGIVRELEQEEKIKSWPYRSRMGMTAIYTLPDAKDPRTKEMIEAKPAAPAKKATAERAVPVPPRAAAPILKPAPKNGNGAFSDVIVLLEGKLATLDAQRQQINVTLETLRALA